MRSNGAAELTPHGSLGPEELAAYFALMEVSSQLRHAVEQQLRQTGQLTYVQFQILATLSDPPGQRRMTDLADRLVLSRSALTYQVSLLERRSLVRRTPSLDDERSTTVEVTDSGRMLMQRVVPGHVEVVSSRFLSALSPDDLQALTSILGRVRDRMRGAPPRSASSRRRRPAAS